MNLRRWLVETWGVLLIPQVHFQGSLRVEEVKKALPAEKRRKGREGAHTWDHLLLAKFYNQRVSG